jgi:protein-S-isoprenylcysteine O-methyltransferase Ste14
LGVISTLGPIVAAVVAVALVVLAILMIATVASDSFRLWPTPGKNSWQNYTFWPLFRTSMGGLPVAAILLADLSGPLWWLQLLIGIPLIAVGFGLTFYAYFDLGIENTYGADESLVTGGLYHYTRNPQYVASIMGYLGIGAAAGASVVWALVALAVLVYSLMPLAEEPWLRKKFGADYDHYMKTTPRFLSWRKLPFIHMPQESGN